MIYPFLANSALKVTKILLHGCQTILSLPFVKNTPQKMTKIMCLKKKKKARLLVTK